MGIIDLLGFPPGVFTSDDIERRRDRVAVDIHRAKRCCRSGKSTRQSSALKYPIGQHSIRLYFASVDGIQTLGCRRAAPDQVDALSVRGDRLAIEHCRRLFDGSGQAGLVQLLPVAGDAQREELDLPIFTAADRRQVLYAP